MKLKKIFALLSIPSLFLFAACEKKESEPDPELETTFKLTEDQAISEGIDDDANVVFFEAAANGGLIGHRVTQVFQSTNILSCATVTITPQNSFPRTIVIDFGTGCTSADGISRKGKINITLSDSVHHPGATAVMTFDNYYTVGFKVEGTITWTNTSTQSGISWLRQITNGRVIEPLGGYYWLHEGTKNVIQTAGANTPLNLLDDVYSVTGSHIVTNPAGKTRTVTIVEALEKKTICHNVSQGKMKIQAQSHFAILDYGDGTCDNIATITIDGTPPRTILLP
jgi:FlaG/FlaF family flagellin (archaellin)